MNFVNVARCGSVDIGAVTGVQELLVHRVEVQYLVVLFGVGGDELITQTGVDGEVGESLPVILNVPEMPEAVIVHLVGCVELVVASGSEEEVAEVSGLYCGCRSCRTILAGIEVFAELRMKVRDSLVQPAVLVSDLEAMSAPDPGVVHLWVGLSRIGEL